MLFIIKKIDYIIIDEEINKNNIDNNNNDNISKLVVEQRNE